MTNPTAPHSIDAEQALLGAIFVDPTCLADVAAVIKQPEFFFRVSHQHIYRAMLACEATLEGLDWVTVLGRMEQAGVVAECGGADAIKLYFSDITNGIPSSYGVTRYASIVRDKALKRAAVVCAGDLKAAALDETKSASEVLNLFAKAALDLQGDTLGGQPRNVADFVAEAQAASQGGGIGGVMAPWESLNTITTGWKPGQLIVVAAGTGVGKSAFAAAIAGQNIETGVLLFSLEMMGREVASRMVCMRAGIDSRKYDMGKLNAEERVSADAAANELRGNLWIDDTAGTDIAALRAKAIRWNARHGLGLVIVDYLGLVDEKIEGANRVQVVGAISRGLKMLAMECKVPVIALHQLNRDSAKERREPQLHDLRDSGNVEQDANQVILLHRESQDDDTGIDTIKVRVAKNRGGPVSSTKLHFQRKYTRFLEIDTSESARQQFRSSSAGTVDGTHKQVFSRQERKDFS